MKAPRPLELLAPARDKDVALAAIAAGADAVYMGGPSHGARAAAANSLADIADVVRKAHEFNARVYVTLNTLVFDSEIPAVEQQIRSLWSEGVDALIVQDLGILRMDIPPIDLHASTQCDIRTPAKARFLADLGFSQLVIPRESTLDEIKAFAQAAPKAKIEGFIHGALCVSYSGDCQASYVCTGRSANRGCCSQICRLPFTLTDADGNVLAQNRHLLSLRDLNRLDHLAEMAHAGVSSFKIEGRLKEASYVKNVVAAYRRALDDIIEADPLSYRRASDGRVETSFSPNLAKSFNRGFTPFFLSRPKPSDRMANILTPKAIGEEVGITAGAVRNGVVKVRASRPINPGDGLCFFDSEGGFQGFRANRFDPDKSLLHLANHKLEIPHGTRLMRNHDQAFETSLVRPDSARRTIAVDAAIRCVGSSLVADLKDESGVCASVALQLESHPQPSRSPQQEVRRRIFAKTGDTIFTLRAFDDRLGALFIPSSVITELRRQAFEALATARRASYIRVLRRPETPDTKFPDGCLDYHHNVANNLARALYADHGASGSDALEVVPSLPATELKVMTSRYCIRRELGLCRKPDAPSLWLAAEGNVRFRLDFDCRNCQMFVIKEGR